MAHNLLDASFQTLDYILMNPDTNSQSGTVLLDESVNFVDTTMNESLGILHESMIDNTLCCETDPFEQFDLNNSLLVSCRKGELPLEKIPNRVAEHVNKLIQRKETIAERKKQQATAELWKQQTVIRETSKLTRAQSLSCLNNDFQTPVNTNRSVCHKTPKVDCTKTKNDVISSLHKLRGKFRMPPYEPHDMSSSFNFSRRKSASFHCLANECNFEDLTTVNVDLEDSIPSEDEMGLPKIIIEKTSKSPAMTTNSPFSQTIVGTTNDQSLESNEILAVTIDNVTPTRKILNEEFFVQSASSKPLGRCNNSTSESTVKNDTFEVKNNSTSESTVKNDTFEAKDDTKPGNRSFEIKKTNTTFEVLEECNPGNNNTYDLAEVSQHGNLTYEVEKMNETFTHSSSLTSKQTPSRNQYRRTNSNPEISFSSASKPKKSDHSYPNEKLRRCLKGSVVGTEVNTAAFSLTLKKLRGDKREGCDPVKAASSIQACVKEECPSESQGHPRNVFAQPFEKPLRRSISCSTSSLNGSFDSFENLNKPVQTSTPESKVSEKKAVKATSIASNIIRPPVKSSGEPNPITVYIGNIKVPGSKLKAPGAIKPLPNYQHIPKPEPKKSINKSPTGNEGLAMRRPISTIQKSALGDSILINRQTNLKTKLQQKTSSKLTNNTVRGIPQPNSREKNTTINTSVNKSNTVRGIPQPNSREKNTTINTSVNKSKLSIQPLRR